MNLLYVWNNAYSGERITEDICSATGMRLSLIDRLAYPIMDTLHTLDIVLNKSIV